MSYTVCEVSAYDRRTRAQIVSLLSSEGLTLDAHLDYTCVALDEDGSVVATGSCFASTLRCFAVSREHQGEGLLNMITSHLVEVQAAHGNFHLFLYTKPKSARFSPISASMRLCGSTARSSLWKTAARALRASAKGSPVRGVWGARRPS